jgi:CubicO group peptidase (beta-lactamase class C family)
MRRTMTMICTAIVIASACSSNDSDRDANGTGEGTTTSSQNSPSTTNAASARDFSAINPIVSTFVTDNNLNGATLVIVDRTDGVVFHEHWGEFDADRVSLVASSSKMITAGVVLRLHDDGLLDVDAPIVDVVDWGADHPEITPAQLISNSSGLVGLLPNPTFAPYLCQYLWSGTLQGCAETILTTDGDDGEVVPPDTEFRYGGAQWQVAGAVAEVASGKPWSQLIDEIYVEPCGLDALGYNNHFAQLGGEPFSYPTAFTGDPDSLKPTENPNMEGGAYVTSSDYAKLLLMHLRDGRCDDSQVLSPAALDRLHEDRIGTAYRGDAGDPGTGYGMGWWVDRSTGRISDGGAYGSVPWLDLEDGYGAYLVIEATSSLGQQLAGELYEPVESAMTA